MDPAIIGVTCTPLRIIKGGTGDVMHAINCEDAEFRTFGEAYFSTVTKGAIKGWKKHTRMVLNLVVPVGKIRFVIYDDRPGSATQGKHIELVLSPLENYQRLTIEPGLWVAFEGMAEGENILLNVASIRHDPAEAVNLDLTAGPMPYPR